MFSLLLVSQHGGVATQLSQIVIKMTRLAGQASQQAVKPSRYCFEVHCTVTLPIRVFSLFCWNTEISIETATNWYDCKVSTISFLFLGGVLKKKSGYIYPKQARLTSLGTGPRASWRARTRWQPGRRTHVRALLLQLILIEFISIQIRNG